MDLRVKEFLSVFLAYNGIKCWMVMSIETLNKCHVQKFTMLKVIDIFILLIFLNYKVSIFSRAKYEPKTRLYSMKKKELREKFVLEGLSILH